MCTRNGKGEQKASTENAFESTTAELRFASLRFLLSVLTLPELISLKRGPELVLGRKQGVFEGDSWLFYSASLQKTLILVLKTTTIV